LVANRWNCNGDTPCAVHPTLYYGIFEKTLLQEGVERKRWGAKIEGGVDKNGQNNSYKVTVDTSICVGISLEVIVCVSLDCELRNELFQHPKILFWIFVLDLCLLVHGCSFYDNPS